jgi:hypothetical protein
MMEANCIRFEALDPVLWTQYEDDELGDDFGDFEDEDFDDLDYDDLDEGDDFDGNGDYDDFEGDGEEY